MSELIHLCDATVERETEKAVLLDVSYDSATGCHGMKTWFPRSTLKIEGNVILVADWFLAKKERELRSELRGFYGIISQPAKFLAA